MYNPPALPNFRLHYCGSLTGLPVLDLTGVPEAETLK
jgi:hypothetical protein